MKYKVVLGWRKAFIFDDLNEAASFANLAASHGIDLEEVRIEFIPEKELEEEDDE